MASVSWRHRQPKSIRPRRVQELIPEQAEINQGAEVRLIRLVMDSIREFPDRDGTLAFRSASSANIPSPPVRTTQRKRGKSMSRRKGQNPTLCIGTRNDGSQYFYFQYWLDVAGEDARKRRREIVGPIKTKSGGLTKTEAQARKMKFLAELNNRFVAPPTSKTFSDAVKHYRRCLHLVCFANRRSRRQTAT